MEKDTTLSLHKRKKSAILDYVFVDDPKVVVGSNPVAVTFLTFQ